MWVSFAIDFTCLALHCAVQNGKVNIHVCSVLFRIELTHLPLKI